MSKKIKQTAGRDQLGEFAPMFAHLNDDVLFGEVWNEEAISVKKHTTTRTTPTRRKVLTANETR